EIAFEVKGVELKRCLVGEVCEFGPVARHLMQEEREGKLSAGGDRLWIGAAERGSSSSSGNTAAGGGDIIAAARQHALRTLMVVFRGAGEIVLARLFRGSTRNGLLGLNRLLLGMSLCLICLGGETFTYPRCDCDAK